MFSFIDLDKLLDILDAYKQSDESMIACSLITTCQCVHAYLSKPEMRYGDGKYKIYHDDILNYMLGEMYDIGTDIDLSTKDGREDKEALISSIIPDREDNFISVRFDASSILFMVTVYIPYFVSSREFEFLVSYNEKLKSKGFDIYVEMSSFNPITGERIEDSEMYFDQGNSRQHLDMAIDFMRKNERIVDYDLPFDGERTIQNSLQSEEKTI